MSRGSVRYVEKYCDNCGDKLEHDGTPIYGRQARQLDVAGGVAVVCGNCVLDVASDSPECPSC
ncbi:MAG: hypothetical protein ABEK59_06480 [Halobacteria archaeon]